MAMTRAEWEALQRRLPSEDRVSYDDYLASLGTNVAMDMSSRRYTAGAIAAGLTPTPIEKAVISTRYEGKGKNRVKITQYSDGTESTEPAPEEESGKTVTGVTYEGKGKNRVKVTKYSDGTETREPAPEEDSGKTVTGSQYIGTGANRILRTFYSDGTYTDTPAPDITNESSNADLLALIRSLQSTIANLSNKTATDAAADKAAKDLAARQSAFDVLYSEMDAIGLAALVEPLRGLIQKNVSPSEFAVELRQTEAYKMRFAANDARLKKGLRVLQPGEYIRVEDAYRQTLRAYGLKQFDNDEYVRQFIENDISSAELSDRVAMAVQRVQNADPAIARTLRDFYGIGQSDLVAYVLDPNQQLQKIQRQIAAAEIGTAARVQGLEAGVGVSEQLAAQGITQAEARRGYATIADVLPTAEKLSQIYGATLEEYDMSQAEQEVFNQLASAQRRRERLSQREIAQFSGQSGLGRTSLDSESRGQF